MKKAFIIILAILGFLVPTISAFAVVFAADDLPSWGRLFGPTGDGIAPTSEDSVPLTWSETENVRWKLRLEGKGLASPVYRDGKLWLAEATEDGTKLSLRLVDAESGEIVDSFVREVAEPSKFSRNENTYATPTPVLDGDRIFLYFNDLGVLCLNADDLTPIWERPDLRYNFDIGAGSSPILWENLLILNIDSIEQDGQFVVALDKATGETVWKTPRSFDMTNVYWDTKKAFSTNRVVEFQGTPYLLSLGAQAAYAYEPATGKEIWRFDYPGGFSNSLSPFVYNDLAFVHDGFGKNVLYAIELDSEGLVPDENIRWTADKNIPRVANPILFEGAIYLAGENGTFSCLDAETGDVFWKKRVGGRFWASPILQNGRIFFWDSQEGKTVVIEADPEKCEILATNLLDDGCVATPILLGKTLFVRTTTALYRIEKP